MVEVYVGKKEVAEFTQDKHDYLIDYRDFTLQNSIALSLPNTKKFYTYTYRFPPFFETFLPEGYLYEIFKNLLTKEFGYIDDYLVFSKLAPNIQGRVGFKSDFSRLDFDFFNIETIMRNDTDDTFRKLLETFLDKNAISGVQPKTVALLQNKETLRVKEHIVKTWGPEYPYLAENEYFCLKACERAGIEIPRIALSQNKRFLIVENFIFHENETFGFEEILSLQDRNRHEKYAGSYEQVAKIVYRFTTHKKESLGMYYKLVVMNYLLKNGDAHLKNFGLLYRDDFSRVWLAPAYDVVNTTSYLYRDKPALTMHGKKVWFGREALVEFGIKHCLLSSKEAAFYYAECADAVRETIVDIEAYIEQNRAFASIGKRMVESFKISLQHETVKELPLELTRTW